MPVTTNKLVDALNNDVLVPYGNVHTYLSHSDSLRWFVLMLFKNPYDFLWFACIIDISCLISSLSYVLTILLIVADNFNA